MLSREKKPGSRTAVRAVCSSSSTGEDWSFANPLHPPRGATLDLVPGLAAGDHTRPDPCLVFLSASPSGRCSSVSLQTATGCCKNLTPTVVLASRPPPSQGRERSASRESAIVTGKRESGGGRQPGKPGGCLHREHLLVFVLLVDQPVTSYKRGHLRHGCSPTTRLMHFIPEQGSGCSGIRRHVPNIFSPEIRNLPVCSWTYKPLFSFFITLFIARHSVLVRHLRAFGRGCLHSLAAMPVLGKQVEENPLLWVLSNDFLIQFHTKPRPL